MLTHEKWKNEIILISRLKKLGDFFIFSGLLVLYPYIFNVKDMIAPKFCYKN